MEVSFILLNYKQKGFIKQSIRGIQQCQIRVPYEIIVVDNDSRDGCEDSMRAEFPEIKTIVLPENIGFAAGNNAGIRESSGKYIIIMNPDIALLKNAVEKLVSFFEKHPHAGIVGPKLIHPDGSIQYSCRRFPNILTPLYRRTILGKFAFAKKSVDAYLMKEWEHNAEKRVHWLFGAFLVINKDALMKTGLFDERFFLYYEDLDLCRRFWENGYEVWYCPDVELVHYHQRLSAQKLGAMSLLQKATRIHIISSIKYFSKYMGKIKPQIHEKE